MTTVQTLMLKALIGLDHMHALGIAHRDIKPSSVLINPDTTDVRISDFRCA